MVGEIEQTCRQNGIEVLSFHPFSSPMESVYLFSTYDRRIEEMIQLYSEFFGTMKRLGAKIFVLHGAILSSKCPPEHYVKQFRLLAETGRKYGVTVAQENVSYCLSGDLEFLKMMKRELGGYARFVLDLKQGSPRARRYVRVYPRPRREHRPPSYKRRLRRARLPPGGARRV